MPKVAAYFSLATLPLDRDADKPLHRQLYENLQKEILEGRLPPGTRLPPTRELASELSLSRNTVGRAYEQLVDEGYLESKIGSGTRVTLTLPEQMLNVDVAESEEQQVLQERDIKFSKRGEAIMATSMSAEGQKEAQYWGSGRARAFSPALPALDAFPMKVWEKCLHSSLRELDPRDSGYQDVMGYEPLRQELANYVQIARGVRCSPDQIMITNGTQHALSLICNLLLDEGDDVWVEDPSFSGIQVALKAQMANLIPVHVDEEGLVVEEGIAKAEHARMVYISPSHQYPLGVTMSLTRRLQLLQWAQEHSAWIIEDDYDSEYRYEGYPLSALQGLDTSGQVLYIGTFSKVLAPSLRLGYLIVPHALVDALKTARRVSDRGQSLLVQVTLSQFIKEGHFARHIRRMRALYVKRQELLIKEINKEGQDILTVEPHAAGLHLIAWLDNPKSNISAIDLSQRLLDEGIDAPSLSRFAFSDLGREGLLLGYTAPEHEIIAAARTLRIILADMVAKEIAQEVTKDS